MVPEVYRRSLRNLCLDIELRADGTIPVIMQERLFQIGRWLAAKEIFFRRKPGGAFCHGAPLAGRDAPH